MKYQMQKSTIAVTVLISSTAWFFLQLGLWGLVSWLSLLVVVPACMLFISTKLRNVRSNQNLQAARNSREHA